MFDEKFSDRETKVVTINELNKIIEQHFGYKSCCTLSVEVGSFSNQYNTEKVQLGPGAVLTITFLVDKKRGGGKCRMLKKCL